MADNEETEQFEFKVTTKAGETLDQIIEHSGEVTIEYSNGDKFEGQLINGVS